MGHGGAALAVPDFGALRQIFFGARVAFRILARRPDKDTAGGATRGASVRPQTGKDKDTGIPPRSPCSRFPVAPPLVPTQLLCSSVAPPASVRVLLFSWFSGFFLNLCGRGGSEEKYG